MATHSASLTFCHSTTRLHSTATDRCAAIATPVACTRRATTPARHPANAMLARCGALTIPTTFNRKLSPAAPLTRASARRNVRAAFMVRATLPRAWRAGGACDARARVCGRLTALPALPCRLRHVNSRVEHVHCPARCARRAPALLHAWHNRVGVCASRVRAV
jgi:hypothetical protein